MESMSMQLQSIQKWKTLSIVKTVGYQFSWSYFNLIALGETFKVKNQDEKTGERKVATIEDLVTCLEIEVLST